MVQLINPRKISHDDHSMTSIETNRTDEKTQRIAGRFHRTIENDVDCKLQY
jgi:hypothetical protein